MMLQARRFLYECAPLKALTYLNAATVVLKKADFSLNHPDDVYEDPNRESLINEATALTGAVKRLYLGGDAHYTDQLGHESGDVVLDEYQRGLKAFYLHQYQDAKSILMGVLQTSFDANHGVFFYTVGILSWIHFIAGELDQWSVLASSWLDRIGESRSHNQAVAWFEGSFIFGSLERGETSRASLQLEEASALLNSHPPRDIQFNLLIANAMLAMEEQRWVEAERVLSEAERLSRGLPKVVTQSFYSVHALKAQLILQTKGPEEALQSLDTHECSENVATFAYQHESLTRARALLSMDKPKEALLLAARVKEWSGEHACTILRIRSLVLEAVAQQKMRRDDKADALFTEAVRIARAVGSVQPFIIPVPEMNLLLNKAHRATRYSMFLTKLMALNGTDVLEEQVHDISLSCLSKREMEVFDLLVKGMSNPEIAQTLCRSLGTVKIHVHNIYRKTGANNRVAAISIYNRAREIGFA